MKYKGPTLIERAFLGVVCLRPKAVVGAACVVIGALIVVGAVKAQSLVNFPSKTPLPAKIVEVGTAAPTPPRQRVMEYSPQRPPLASDPGVLQAPELIARDLNETDASYTARMVRLGQQLKADDVAAQQDLARVLQQVSHAGNGQGSDVVTVRPRPALEVRSPVPASQRMPQVYDDGRGHSLPAE